MRSPTSRALAVLAVLATAAAALRLVVDGWRDAALFAGVSLVCTGALAFRAESPAEGPTL